MVEWSDPASTPSLDTILTNVSIYWFTGTYPTSIWCYRAVSSPSTLSLAIRAGRLTSCAVLQLLGGPRATGGHLNGGKPKAFSWFPNEIAPPPKEIVRADKAVTHFYEHDKVRPQPPARQARRGAESCSSYLRAAISRLSRCQTSSGLTSRILCRRFGRTELSRGFHVGKITACINGISFIRFDCDSFDGAEDVPHPPPAHPKFTTEQVDPLQLSLPDWLEMDG